MDNELLDAARELVKEYRILPDRFKRLADIVAARDAAGPQPDPWPVVKAARELVDFLGKQLPLDFRAKEWHKAPHIERARLLSALRVALVGLPATETQDDEVAVLRAELQTAFDSRDEAIDNAKTPEEQAVLDAAKAVRRHHDCSREDYIRNSRDWWYKDDVDGPLIDAVDALIAAEADNPSPSARHASCTVPTEVIDALRKWLLPPGPHRPA